MKRGRSFLIALAAVLAAPGAAQQGLVTPVAATTEKLAELEARDPLYRPRADIPDWTALDETMPAAAPAAVQLAARRGRMTAIAQDQQWTLLRQLYLKAAPLLARREVAVSRDAAIVHVWGRWRCAIPRATRPESRLPPSR